MDSVWINIGSTLAGVSVGYGLKVFQDFLKSKKEKQANALLIASGLRQWMELCRTWVSDTANAIDSDGQIGRSHRSLPDFPFQDDLERITKLDKELAHKVFRLLHQKFDADDKIAATAEYGDHESASSETVYLIAKGYLDADPIYKELSKRAKWPFEASSPRTREWMQAKVDRHLEIQEQRAASLRKLLGKD